MKKKRIYTILLMITVVFMSILTVYNSHNLYKNKTIEPHGCCIPGQLHTISTPKKELFFCLNLLDFPEMKIGEIETGVSFPKIKKLLAKYDDIMVDECNNCWIVNFCGQCFASIFNGTSFEKNSSMCEKRKIRFLSNLTNYMILFEKYGKDIGKYL